MRFIQSGFCAAVSRSGISLMQRGNCLQNEISFHNQKKHDQRGLAHERRLQRWFFTYLVSVRSLSIPGRRYDHWEKDGVQKELKIYLGIIFSMTESVIHCGYTVSILTEKWRKLL